MSQIDEIKHALDIVQVVSETVDLDTRSRTPKANCPFHAERTPSFVVFPAAAYKTMRARCTMRCSVVVLRTQISKVFRSSSVK